MSIGFVSSSCCPLQLSRCAWALINSTLMTCSWALAAGPTVAALYHRHGVCVCVRACMCVCACVCVCVCALTYQLSVDILSVQWWCFKHIHTHSNTHTHTHTHARTHAHTHTHTHTHAHTHTHTHTHTYTHAYTHRSATFHLPTYSAVWFTLWCTTPTWTASSWPSLFATPSSCCLWVSLRTLSMCLLWMSLMYPMQQNHHHAVCEYRCTHFQVFAVNVTYVSYAAKPSSCCLWVSLHTLSTCLLWISLMYPMQQHHRHALCESIIAALVFYLQHLYRFCCECHLCVIGSKTIIMLFVSIAAHTLTCLLWMSLMYPMCSRTIVRLFISPICHTHLQRHS